MEYRNAMNIIMATGNGYRTTDTKRIHIMMICAECFSVIAAPMPYATAFRKKNSRRIRNREADRN
jgi:hypothetical protein